MDKSALKWSDYQNLARWVSRRIAENARRHGRVIDEQDVLQEVSIVFLECVRHFDPDRGFKFSTYFVRSALHEAKGIVNRLCGAGQTMEVSLNQVIGDEDDSSELVELIEDLNAENPEARVSRDQRVSNAMVDSPMLHRLAEILTMKSDPEIKAQLDALKAQAAWAKQMNIHMPPAQVPTHLTLRMLAKMLGFNWRDRQRLIEMMNEVTA